METDGSLLFWVLAIGGPIVLALAIVYGIVIQMRRRARRRRQLREQRDRMRDGE